MRPLTELAARVDGDPSLVRRGRHLDTELLLAIGEDQHIITIRSGRITGVRSGALVMPSWAFALRADAETWELFFRAVPPPGSHDLFALLRSRRLRLEGDVGTFMTNLLYFKGLVTKLRNEVDA